MNEFEFEFVNDLNRLKLKRYEVAEELGVSLPTLKSRLQNPNRFNLMEVKKLKGLGFTLSSLSL